MHSLNVTLTHIRNAEAQQGALSKALFESRIGEWRLPLTSVTTFSYYLKSVQVSKQLAEFLQLPFKYHIDTVYSKTEAFSALCQTFRQLLTLYLRT